MVSAHPLDHLDQVGIPRSVSESLTNELIHKSLDEEGIVDGHGRVLESDGIFSDDSAETVIPGKD